jgi:hypothetical protein
LRGLSCGNRFGMYFAGSPIGIKVTMSRHCGALSGASGCGGSILQSVNLPSRSPNC